MRPAAVPPGLVLEHEADAPAALLAEWAADRGEPIEVIAAGDPVPDPAGRPFLVSLGSEASAFDDDVPWLARERGALDRALEHEVPILGICFGAQHLARALGGTVAPAARPEVGWLDIETFAPGVVPPGPWLQWHRDAFTVPPGAELLARSPVGPQAFRLGPHLGVQFHPEVTAAVVADWVAGYPASIERAGTTPAAVLAGSAAHADDARARAWALFDGFLAAARGRSRMAPGAVG
jgi:GMP synthase-like glutamine amidotransferase